MIERLTGKSSSFAIQIDVDEEQAIAARLEVQAMPTLIAFASGVEHDRLVGGCNATAFLAWLDIVERGERFEDAQRAKRVAREERRARATAHLSSKRYDEALLDYVWLWNETRDSELLDAMRELAAAHAPARAAFAELRDAATPKSADALQDLVAWMALNQVIDDEDTTLTWYAANAADLPATRAVAFLVETMIVPLLMQRGRWIEAGVALSDPRATLLRLIEARPPELRSQIANMVRALYAAGRDERASDLEWEAEAVDASPEMTAALATAKANGRNDRASHK